MYKYAGWYSKFSWISGKKLQDLANKKQVQILAHIIRLNAETPKIGK